MNKKELKQKLEHTMEILFIIMTYTACGIIIFLLIQYIPKIINQLLLWQLTGIYIIIYVIAKNTIIESFISCEWLSFNIHAIIVITMYYKIGATILKDKIYIIKES